MKQKKLFFALGIILFSLFMLSACDYVDAICGGELVITDTGNIGGGELIITDVDNIRCGELTINIDFQRQPGWASNQFAVWIEDMYGNHLRTIYTTRWTAAGGFRTRPMSIPLWVERFGLAEREQAEVDAIASPTPQSGTLSYLWDLTDDDGNIIGPGEIRFIVEGSLRWGNRVIYTGVIDVGGDAAMVIADAEFIFEESNGQPALDAGAPEVEMITAVPFQ